MITEIADSINFELNKRKCWTLSASILRGDVDIIKIIARQ